MQNERYVLAWSNGEAFGKGFQTVKECVYENETDKMVTYQYGPFNYNKPDQIWGLDELNLRFINVFQMHIPTNKEMLLKRLFGKKYQVLDMVTPPEDSIVIASYMNGRHYEVVEYHHNKWNTNFQYPLEPDCYAYIPNEILNICRK